MSDKKTLQNLTLKDNFMFAAVMMEGDNCHRLLELVLGVELDRVIVDTEKSIVYHPEYHGIRLDVYAKDEHNTHYNIEMQVCREKLNKRVRYYHSQIDTELLGSGVDYEELPDSFVIFVCDFDPFGLGKYCYTERRCFKEAPEYTYIDGNYSIFLSTKGTNENEVPKELVNFLKFVETDRKASITDADDAFVAQLSKSMEKIKRNREMGSRFMLLEDMLRRERRDGMAEGREQGRAEGRAEGCAENVLMILGEKMEVPDVIKKAVYMQNDIAVLHDWLHISTRVNSLEEFIEQSHIKL